MIRTRRAKPDAARRAVASTCGWRVVAAARDRRFADVVAAARDRRRGDPVATARAGRADAFGTAGFAGRFDRALFVLIASKC
ncbi:MAG: hypothetical protein R2752_22285 [Vicinamibacterales bacterium]